MVTTELELQQVPVKDIPPLKHVYPPGIGIPHIGSRALCGARKTTPWSGGFYRPGISSRICAECERLWAERWGR